jgi:hypothetical protein
MFPEIQSMRERARTRVSKSLPAFRRTRLNCDGAETRAHIVHVCRTLMVSGRFRPVQKELLGAGLRLKALRYHFRSLADLHEEALDDNTKQAIVRLVMPNSVPATVDVPRIVRAVMIGRLVAT